MNLVWSSSPPCSTSFSPCSSSGLSSAG